MQYRSSLKQLAALCFVFFALFSASQAATQLVTSNSNGTGAGTLRDAVSIAADGDTIRFDSTVTQIDLSGSDISIMKSLTIIGNGAETTTITGSGTINIFFITTTGSLTVHIEHLTLRNGVGTRVDPTNFIVGGGAIHLEKGTLFVRDCEFRDHVANLGQSGGPNAFGGACVLFDNAVFTNCTFDNNSVSGTQAIGGGAVYFDEFFRPLDVLFTNCTFYNNNAANNGGAIYGSGGFIGNTNSLRLTNCTFYDNNTTTGTGSCVYYDMGNVVTTAATFYVQNTIFDRTAGLVPASVDIANFGGSGRFSLGGNIWHDMPMGILPMANDRADSGNGDAGLTGILQSNGGHTRTIAIATIASHAVDFGTTGFSEPPLDQRGHARSGTIDAGTFEFQYSTPIVATTNTIITTNEDTPVTITVTVSDAESPTSALVLTATSSNVSLVQNSGIVQQGATMATSRFQITPVANASGVANITITVTDPEGFSSSTTFIVTVHSINDAPVAVNDRDTTCPATPKVVLPLLNDADIEHDPLSISTVTQGANGAVLILPGNTSLRYSPNPGFSGNDAFTYTITDGNGGSSTATVIIYVLPLVTANAGADAAFCTGSGGVQLSGSGASTAGGISYSWSPATGLSNPNIANPTANPASTTVYTLTVTDANGCQASDQVTVSILSPVAAAASSNATICSGSAIQLQATGGNTYSWSPGTGLSNSNIANPIASPTTTTTYTVTVSNAGNCASTASVTITVKPRPVASAGANVSICAGSSVQLHATGGGTYSWSPATGLSNPNIANPIASPTVTTSYIVTVSSTNGCQSKDTVIVTVTPATVSITVILEGPYIANSTMSTILASLGYLPLTSPYSTGGSVSSIPANVVDWVVVEFRTALAASSTVLRRAAFLKKDGTIIGLDGNALTAPGLSSGTSYYIVIRHRNHLAIMSSAKVSISQCGISWNFTTSQSQAYSTCDDPMVKVSSSPNRYGMIASDPTRDGISNVFDRVKVILDLGSTGYQDSDLNLNGSVNLQDLGIILTHPFTSTQVP